MTTPNGWIRPTFWPITRPNHAKSHQGCVDRAMLAPSFIITRTNGAVPRNSNTGKSREIFTISCLLFLIAISNIDDKKEPSKKPPRLCRQGYACPQFHNNKDKWYSPKKLSMYRYVQNKQLNVQ